MWGHKARSHQWGNVWCVRRCVSIKPNVAEGVGSVCVFCSKGPAWLYSVNGADCYCGHPQWNLKITRAVEGDRGAKPTGFYSFSLETLKFFFIPRDHKLGSQSKHCGSSSPHIKQTALFLHRRCGIQNLAKDGDGSPVGTHLFAVSLSFCEGFIKLRAAFQSVWDQDWAHLIPSRRPPCQS